MRQRTITNKEMYIKIYNQGWYAELKADPEKYKQHLKNARESRKEREKNNPEKYKEKNMIQYEKKQNKLKEIKYNDPDKYNEIMLSKKEKRKKECNLLYEQERLEKLKISDLEKQNKIFFLQDKLLKIKKTNTKENSLNKTLSSWQRKWIAIKNNPERYAKYLLKEKRKRERRKNDPERHEHNILMSSIRSKIKFYSDPEAYRLKKKNYHENHPEVTERKNRITREKRVLIQQKRFADAMEDINNKIVRC